uniref:Retrovirus-related Pol polyprotein from transposon TNT 1-94-like beta-barrel domain-containing protein n=1 Tax=Tanacetum cinerariifolium TaxID=118510 RepID=A0A6L2LV71_TANCI|nr:hypothetical protein [Tanacetum cinerariifolium]
MDTRHEITLSKGDKLLKSSSLPDSDQNKPLNKPQSLGRFVVANFNEVTYRLSLDSGDKIEVTHSKDHEILGVPVGGYSLFLSVHRPVEHEFVTLWVSQFYPKFVKDIRVNDITSKLVLFLEVDFLFKVNFLTLFTNTMGMVDGLDCLDVVRCLREDCIIPYIDWCSKHMTGNRALLTSFVEKFLGTVRFGNNDFVVIAGYGDIQVAQKKVKTAFENADSSSRAELIPSKIILAYAAIFVKTGVLQIGISAMVIENKVVNRVISSPNHPTTNIEDAFSSNFPDYTTASPIYLPASPGNISPDPPNNLSKYLLASLAIPPFHDMQAYNAVANKPPIPLQDPIAPPKILTLSPMPPKRKSTSEASAMTHAAIRKLVADSVAIALEAQAATMASTSNPNSNSGPRKTPVARNNCAKKNKLKFAINTLTEEALFWCNSFAQHIGVKEAYKITRSKFKRLLIKKYCSHTEIKKMKEAITMTQKLIEQVMKHNSVQETNNHKQNLEDRRNTTNDNNNNNYRNNNHSNDNHQQQNRKQETFMTYTDTNGYTGNRPLYERCTLHHIGPCTVKCQTYNKIGHLMKNDRNKGPSTIRLDPSYSF